MRPLALLCTILILISCSKENEQQEIPAVPNLNEQILELTDNNLFIEALECSDLSLEEGVYTFLIPQEQVLQQFLNDVNQNSFRSFKESIGKQQYNAWLGNHILPESAKVENLHTAFIPTKGINSESQEIHLHWWRNKNIVRVNGQWVSFQRRDQEIDQGIVHQIDQVLSPSTLSKLIRANAENFSILERALRISNLAATLNNDQSKYTMLAPNDQAFDRYFQEQEVGDLDGYIEKNGVDALKNLIQGHLVEGSLEISELTGTSQSSLSQNGSLNFYLEDGSIKVNRGLSNNARSAQVLITDITCFNGSLNIIDEVLKLP